MIHQVWKVKTWVCCIRLSELLKNSEQTYVLVILFVWLIQSDQWASCHIELQDFEDLQFLHLSLQKIEKLNQIKRSTEAYGPHQNKVCIPLS